MQIEGNNSKVNITSIFKFVFLSSIGVFLFLIPIPYGEGFSIPVGIVIDIVKSHLHEHTLGFMVFLVSINAILTLMANTIKPKFIMENLWLKSILLTTPLYIISRLIGAIVILMYYFQIGPNMIISEATGGTMIDLTRSLVSILLVISYTMPLLTEFGIMEFVGVLIRNLVRPLFLVPGRSAINLITSWLGASNAAVLLTKKQYDDGYYSGKEAGIIMTNFSLVSIPFCYIVASMIGIESNFTAFYVIISFTGILLAIITPRIKPLSSMPDSYSEKSGKKVDEEVPEGMTKLQYAIESATNRADKSNLRLVISQGNDMLFSVIFGLAPIIIAWGTISLILVEYTPLFKVLSYPMAVYMQVLGLEGAYQAAPATLVGFADMFIPGLILAPLTFSKTKFVVGAVGLVQIIYLTEVGSIIIQSDVPLGFKELLIIFLERTIIALPIITLLTNLFVKF